MVSRKRSSASRSHLPDKSSAVSPRTTAPNPTTTLPRSKLDLFANATTASPRTTKMLQSYAIESGLNPSNDPVTEAQATGDQSFLRRYDIEGDYECMTNEQIVSLLQIIWKYTSRPDLPPVTLVELDAGHRYWLPNNLLAEEWIMVFLFAPAWVLESAPPAVRTAFERQVLNVLGHWPSFADLMQEEENLSASSQSSHPQSGRQQFQMPQPILPTQNGPQRHVHPVYAPDPGSQPGPPSVPNVSVFPLQSVPDGTAAFEQNPAAPPIFDQLLQAQGITVPNFRPGSEVPSDNGNKAWSAERIRAFVEIQRNSIFELPPTAFSRLGTEMSNFRTPESIDVTNCPFETSLVENFTYFSNVCTLNREMCFRAREYWLPMDIARYINYAHDLQTPGIFGRSKIGHHFSKAKAWGEAHPGHVPTASLRNTSTESGARGANKVLHDFFLHSMGDGVVRPPLGRNAQMLTRVIEHVRNFTGDRNVRLSEAATYAQRWNITVPVHEQMNFTNLAVEDQLPSAPFLAIIKADYRNKFNGEDP